MCKRPGVRVTDINPVWSGPNPTELSAHSLDMIGFPAFHRLDVETRGPTGAHPGRFRVAVTIAILYPGADNSSEGPSMSRVDAATAGPEFTRTNRIFFASVRR